MSKLRDAALNADDITIEKVPVPEWGGAVYGVKAMTINEQRKFIQSVSGPNGKVDRDRYSVQLVIRAVVDPETGEPVFDVADAETLNKKSAKAVGRLLEVAARLSGLSGDEDEVEKAMESLDETPDSAGDSD